MEHVSEASHTRRISTYFDPAVQNKPIALQKPAPLVNERYGDFAPTGSRAI
jgi:hypothetical protein